MNQADLVLLQMLQSIQSTSDIKVSSQHCKEKDVHLQREIYFFLKEISKRGGSGTNWPCTPDACSGTNQLQMELRVQDFDEIWIASVK